MTSSQANVGEINTYQDQKSSDKKRNSREVNTCRAFGEPGKQIIHDQWADDCGNAHQSPGTVGRAICAWEHL